GNTATPWLRSLIDHLLLFTHSHQVRSYTLPRRPGSLPHCAQLSYPPTVTPRRAISPGEGLPIRHASIFRGVARLSFTARIGRAPFHSARSASKKNGLSTP